MSVFTDELRAVLAEEQSRAISQAVAQALEASERRAQEQMNALKKQLQEMRSAMGAGSSGSRGAYGMGARSAYQVDTKLGKPPILDQNGKNWDDFAVKFIAYVSSQSEDSGTKLELMQKGSASKCKYQELDALEQDEA